ncbi:unnamed protein product, partial [Ascophyllum nodosum]
RRGRREGGHGRVQENKARRPGVYPLTQGCCQGHVYARSIVVARKRISRLERGLDVEGFPTRGRLGV